MPTWITGAKSVSILSLASGTSAGTAANGAVIESRVWPSAACLRTSLAPIVITAPGLFSTITFQLSPSDKAVATMRARMSGGVLAEVGTTMRMTLDGKDWPSAG